jgi:hypothetical protein
MVPLVLMMVDWAFNWFEAMKTMLVKLARIRLMYLEVLIRVIISITR